MCRKKLLANRILSLALAAVVALAFTIAFTQDVSAASGKSTSVQVPTRITTNYYGYEGKVKDKTVQKFTYDKNGLLILWKRSEGRKIRYKRDKSGGIIEETLINNGSKEDSAKYKLNKKGMPKSAKTYYGREYMGSYKFKYKNGKLYKTSFKSGSYRENVFYYTNGYMKKNSWHNDSEKSVTRYDKNGNETYSYTENFGESKAVYTYNNGLPIKKEASLKTSAVSSKESTTIDYKLDDAGRITKKIISSDYGDDYISQTVFTYTYNKKGSLVKMVKLVKDVYDDGEIDKNYRETTTFKYKTVKVSPKHQKFVYDRMPKIDPKKTMQFVDYGQTLELSFW